MTEYSFAVAIGVGIAAFFCEYVDSTLGMGYGTMLTPALLILGFKPLEIVPVVLLSELITGLLAAFSHQRAGNVNLKPGTTRLSVMVRRLKSSGCIKTFKKEAPLDLKIALLLAVCSIIGTVSAVFIAVNIPRFWLKLYIGFLVFVMGLLIIATLNREYRFSWKKITALGLVASFNKGVSGGGYGPLVMGGQILSGVTSKSAVGITSLAEGLTCAAGVLTYIFTARSSLDWRLAPYVVAGAVLAVPFSARSVKKISARKLKLAIAVLTIALGLFTVVRALRGL